mmetsp:Transcript_14332/g.29716  ORF Transcript_14332/g.29716 Transcript_14332/m.29716 type:complete len:288 (+) Transcript_14332:311-1174(+)
MINKRKMIGSNCLTWSWWDRVNRPTCWIPTSISFGWILKMVDCKTRTAFTKLTLSDPMGRPNSWNRAKPFRVAIGFICKPCWKPKRGKKFSMSGITCIRMSCDPNVLWDGDRPLSCPNWPMKCASFTKIDPSGAKLVPCVDFAMKLICTPMKCAVAFSATTTMNKRRCWKKLPKKREKLNKNWSIWPTNGTRPFIPFGGLFSCRATKILDLPFTCKIMPVCTQVKLPTLDWCRPFEPFAHRRIPCPMTDYCPKVTMPFDMWNMRTSGRNKWTVNPSKKQKKSSVCKV